MVSPNRFNTNPATPRIPPRPPTIRPACNCHPANWLNPRRQRHAELLVEFLRWHGRKIHLDDYTYERIQNEKGLNAHQADLAADDLYTLGMVEMFAGGANVTLKLITDEPVGRFTR